MKFNFSNRAGSPQRVSIQTPARNPFYVDVGEIWRYRHLIPLLIRRDFISEFAQTILGPLWFVIHPIVQSVVFALVFGALAKISTDNATPFLFYNSSLVLWIYFQQSSTYVSQTFINNVGVFGKVYFPRLIAPISTVIFRMVSLLVNYVVFVSFLIIFTLSGADVRPNWWILATPIIVAQVCLLAFGVGAIASAFTTRARDMVQAFGYLITIWMYATPIIYPLSSVSGGYKYLYYLNPMTSMIEVFRYAYLGSGGGVNLILWAVNTVEILVILTIGVFAFNYTEKTVVDTA